MSTPETRQWYKNSERPPKLEDYPIWEWMPHWAEPLKLDRALDVSSPDIQWTHADKPPAPPKPKEKTQAEQDLELWHSFTHISDFSAYIRADQEAKTTAELGKQVEKWFREYRLEKSTLYENVRAIFAQPTTKQEEKDRA